MNGETVDTVVAEFENTYYAKHPVVLPTGDNSNITLWLVLMIASGTACAVLIILDKRFAKASHKSIESEESK